jgi:hypothetical protein
MPRGGASVAQDGEEHLTVIPDRPLLQSGGPSPPGCCLVPLDATLWNANLASLAGSSTRSRFAALASLRGVTEHELAESSQSRLQPRISTRFRKGQARSRMPFC